MKAHINKNATVAQSQDVYTQEANRIQGRYHDAFERSKALEAERDKKLRKSKELLGYIASLRKQPLVIGEWDERLWITLLDRATVMSYGSIVFRFKCGTEITV